MTWQLDTLKESFITHIGQPENMQRTVELSGEQ